MYTFSESLKPVFTYSGEFVNHFYSSLTKDRPFWESIPLIILFTVVILPIILLFSILIILVLSGYEFNFFFNLISFRRGAQPQTTSSHTHLQIEDRLRRELETLTNMINNESKRLISNNATLMISDISCMTLQSHLIESSTDIAVVDADSGLVPYVDNTDTSTEIFRQNVRTIFNRINTRERELKQKLDRLAKDNESLRETLKTKESSKQHKQHKNNSNSSELSSNNEDLMNESSDNEPSRVSTTSIEVAIGLSSNVQCCSPLSHDQATSTEIGNVRRINDSSIEHDDDDDAIYVILDEK